MKVSEFKSYTDALARFATTREKAQGPEALIGIQKRNDTLKLISGHSRAGIVAEIPSHESADGNYSLAVAARPVLQAAKVLPPRADITLKVDKDGLHIETEGGGVFDVASEMPLREAGFAKKPREFNARGRLDKITLKRASKIFKKVCDKVTVPSVQVVDNVGYIVAIAPGNGSQYVNYQFEAENDTPIEGESYNMAGYRDFWEALTHFTEDATIEWGREGILVRSGNIECFSSPYLTSRWDEKTRTAGPPSEVPAPPIMVASTKSDVMFSIERKTLLSIVKGQAPFDEHNRVTLVVGADSIRVSPFGSEDGQEVQTLAEGKGTRSVNADYLSGLLNAMDSKMVTLRWSGGVPAISLSAEEYSQWTILLAPVAL